MREFPCHIRMGFSAAADPDRELWGGDVRVTATDPDRDLAFLEVRPPPGAQVRAARLASTCRTDDDPLVLAIGWPDLTLRRRWGEDPPANLSDHIKRYSHCLVLVEVRGYSAHTSSGRSLQPMQGPFTSTAPPRRARQSGRSRTRRPGECRVRLRALGTGARGTRRRRVVGRARGEADR